MKAADKLLTYETLELITPTAERPQPKFRFRLVVRKIWQHLVRYLNTGNELQVWQRRDRFGEVRWHAYDPVTGNYTALSSEDELRSWIESKYYRG